jgi:hypothetical protein
MDFIAKVHQEPSPRITKIIDRNLNKREIWENTTTTATCFGITLLIGLGFTSTSKHINFILKKQTNKRTKSRKSKDLA